MEAEARAIPFQAFVLRWCGGLRNTRQLKLTLFSARSCVKLSDQRPYSRMPWIIGIAVGGVALVVTIWAWVSRERNAPPDFGTISDQWRNEQRGKERESPDR